MTPDLHFRICMDYSQFLQLQERVRAAGMKVTYEEQRVGLTIVVSIGCTRHQERTLREILDDIGATLQESRLVTSAA